LLVERKKKRKKGSRFSSQGLRTNGSYALQQNQPRKSRRGAGLGGKKNCGPRPGRKSNKKKREAVNIGPKR